VTFILWPFVILIPAIMLTTRYMFAWSFDKIAPAALSKVSSRFHTPVYGTIVACLLFWATLLVVVFQQNLVWPVLAASTMYVFVGNVALTCITAIIFPWRRRDVYQASPIRNLKVGSVPLISLLGVVSLVVCIFNGYLFMVYPSLGLGPWQNAVEILGVAMIVGLALYFLAIYYRKRQGTPIEWVFKEIPPA